MKSLAIRHDLSAVVSATAPKRYTAAGRYVHILSVPAGTSFRLRLDSTSDTPRTVTAPTTFHMDNGEAFRYLYIDNDAQVGEVEIEVSDVLCILTQGGTYAVRPVSGDIDDSDSFTTVAGDQTPVAVNPGRQYLFIQNLGPVGDIWLRFGAAAAASQPSIPLGVGDAWENPATFVAQQAVHIFDVLGGNDVAIWEG